MTLPRWLHRPAFQAAYRLARHGTVGTAIGRLQQSTGKAVEALERNLACGHPGSEIRAAPVLLDRAVRAVEPIDPVGHVGDLERQIVNKPGGDTSGANAWG